MAAQLSSVQTWPEVVECAALSGEMDYLLRVIVSDMNAYSHFVMDTLLKHPSVQDCKTSFVLDRVKSTTAGSDAIFGAVPPRNRKFGDFPLFKSQFWADCHWRF